MSTKFCKVKVEHSTTSQPSSVADAIEAFLQKVRKPHVVKLFTGLPVLGLYAAEARKADVVIRASNVQK